MILWKDSFSCHVASIDAEHQHLFKLVGDLFDIAKNAKDGYDVYDDLQNVFNQLTDYTITHFAHEERMMDEFGYDRVETARHKEEHAAFVQKVQQIGKYDLDKMQHKAIMETATFAVNWIEKHILGTDHRYSAFFTAHGAQ